MEREERIAEVIEAFDAQGHHRTGTEVDNSSGAWLRELLEQQGAEARLETHPFEQFVPGESYLEVEQRRFPGLPLFDGGRTRPEGVRGRLGPVGAAAGVALTIASPGGQAPELGAARTSGQHLAVVSVTTGGRPGLAPRNATSFVKPFGRPVLQVSSEHRGELEAFSNQGAEATVVCTGESRPVWASNVAGRVPGKHTDLPPLVVMTPRSGWWQCASERGGGIACWLEIARAVAGEPLRRDLLLVASTGHELGHWGLEQHLATRPELAKTATLWLHLGASIGAALSPRPLVFASDGGLRALALQSLKAAGAHLVTAAPDHLVPGGEAKNIHERGGRYISLAGGSEVFHLESDRWPDSVDVGAVVADLDACLAILRAIDASGR